MVSSEVDLGFAGLKGGPGAHIAHFFYGRSQMTTVLLPYVAAGLKGKELVCVVVEKEMAPAIQVGLHKIGVDVDQAQESGQLVISPGNSTPEGMRAMVKETADTYARRGFCRVRIAGDMSWGLEKMENPSDRMTWEAIYDQEFAPREDFLALCQYDLTRFSGAVIMDALKTHPLCVNGTVVQKNEFHVQAEDFLKELAGRAA